MEEKKSKENTKTIGQLISGENSSSKKKIVIKKKPRGSKPEQASQGKKMFQSASKQSGQEGSAQSKDDRKKPLPELPIKKEADKPSPIIRHARIAKETPKEEHAPTRQPRHSASEEKKTSDSDFQNKAQKVVRPNTLFPRNDRNPIVARAHKSPSSSPPEGRGGGRGGRPDFRSNRGEGQRPNQGGSGGGNAGGGGRSRGGNEQNRESGTGFSPIVGVQPQQAGSQGRSKRSGGSSDKGREKNNIRGQENAKFFKQSYKKNTGGLSLSSVPKEISIMENVQVGELAKKMNLKPGEIIGKLMKMGMMVTINNIIDSDTASILADEYSCKVNIVSLYDETVIQEKADSPDDYTNRPPVVTIMGHVDHGKTRLLDTIRKSDIIDQESGGITQHIGAYQVHTPNGIITFLDTPGHEAFTSMRARGAKITDIVILVVAADDGVKEQTKEAIDHARAANVPIIVAINKIDLPAANPDKVMQELANFGLQSEDWGGDTIFCKISARENIGIEKLLEMILLQAEMLELKANHGRKAKGTIIEAKLDRVEVL